MRSQASTASPTGVTFKKAALEQATVGTAPAVEVVGVNDIVPTATRTPTSSAIPRPHVHLTCLQLYDQRSITVG